MFCTYILAGYYQQLISLKKYLKGICERDGTGRAHTEVMLLMLVHTTVVVKEHRSSNYRRTNINNSNKVTNNHYNSFLEKKDSNRVKLVYTPK